MNVLIIGSGAREHTIASLVQESPLAERVFVSPGNPGMSDVAEIMGDVSERELLEFIEKEAIEFVIIGPEQPLVEGLADVLRHAGVTVFGPGMQGARLEGSKAFSKAFMEEFSIPTARAAIARTFAEGQAIAGEWEGLPVLKADGLAAGKGVFLPETTAEVEVVLRDLFVHGRLGEAAACLLFEERLYGPEISFFVLRNETGTCYLGSARDYKRAYEGDRGPNTGGMGTISPAEELTPEESAQLADIIEKTHRGLLERKIDYRGVLFIGAMRTKQGLRVLEYNVRFGDPETQSLLPRIQEDMLACMFQCARGEAMPLNVSYRQAAGVCVCIASEGYPTHPSVPQPITFFEREPGVRLFHAGTKEMEGRLVASGGRVFSLVAFGEDVAQARARVYKNIDTVHFQGMWYRKDI